MQGRFYFGDYVNDSSGCDADVSGVTSQLNFFKKILIDDNTWRHGLFQLHAGIAEVAAAKARMFVNKPDGSRALSSSPIHS